MLWVAAILLPALGVGGTALMSWRAVQDDARVRLDRNTEMLRQHALRAFATQEAILAALSRAIARMSWQQVHEDAALHGLMAELTAAGQPLVRGIVVADEQDRVVAASYEFPARPTDLSERGFIRALREDQAMAVGRVGQTQPMDWTAFSIARRAPPRPGGGDRLGSLVVSFSPGPLNAFYASVVEAPRDMVALVRLDGAILARHPAVEDDEGYAPRPAAAAQLAEVLAHQPGLTRTMTPSSVDNRMRLLAARRVGEWPVAVAYGLDRAGLVAIWRQRMVGPLISGIGAAGLLLALTAFAQYCARRQQVMMERRLHAEAQLASASRAASIGLLAAGLAHDVKNLVQAVRSGTRLMDRMAEKPEEVRRCAGLLGDAAERGGRLVDAMLTFASGGDQPISTELDIAAALGQLVALLERTLGSGVRVVADLPAHLPPTRGDKPGFEAAIINLAANARDAMPRGGEVRIQARLQITDESGASGAPPPGHYVVVTVRDTGSGMDAETLARIGEPFFTTKPAGIGTGLGLATVRGFCERIGGTLRIESVPGRGTSVSLWLPVADQALPPAI